MHGWFIYVACSRAGTATATEPISSRICVHFFRGALSPLLVQEFAVGSARPPVRAASAAGHGASTVRRITLQRECTSPALALLLRAQHGAFSHAPTKE